MGERQIGEAELLTRVLDARLQEVHVALPGRVHRFNRTSQTADVTPQVWPDGEELPILPAVPVSYPRSPSRGLYWDLEDGDPGLLIFSEADLSQWRQQGEPGSAADLGRHSLQSAVFFPGLGPRGGEATLPDGALVLEGGDTRLGGPTATEAVLHGDAFRAAMNTWLPLLQAAIVAGGGGDMTTPNANLLAAIDAALSGKVKAE